LGTVGSQLGPRPPGRAGAPVPAGRAPPRTAIPLAPPPAGRPADADGNAPPAAGNPPANLGRATGPGALVRKSAGLLLPGRHRADATTPGPGRRAAPGARRRASGIRRFRDAVSGPLRRGPWPSV